MSAPANAVPLHIVPVSMTDARKYVGAHHRHNLPPKPAMFAVGIEDDAGTLRGVGIAGRPVARMLCDGRTLEVVRTCTDGVPNGNSMIYGAMWRAAKALGYERLYTYTLDEESGASLKASGWTRDADLPARGGWDNGRVRVEVDLFGNQRTPTGPKVRWVKTVGAQARKAS